MHLRTEARVALATVAMLVGPSGAFLATPADAAAPGGCTIVGTSGDDVLIGTSGDDVICGLDGNDKVVGRGGDDVLRAGGGDDLARGGSGDDRVSGGRGDDRVFGQAGDDLVRGDAGDDEVVGGPGNDELGGFRGADEMKGAGDAAGFVDEVRCGPGPDTVAADPADEVRAHDCETVAQNDPPSDLTLAPSSVREDQPVGTDIGVLKALDPDAGDSHTFALVPGAGSADNGLVRIDGDSLESAVRYDFESDSSLSVRVRGTDEAGAFVEKAFTVTVVDANEAPVAVDDDASTTEDTQLDLPVSGAGSPAANDTDANGDPLTVTAASNPTGGTVSVSGGQVHFAPSANLCGDNAGTFAYTVADGAGGTDTGVVTVDLICVDDLPVAVDDDRTVAEDAAAAALDVLTNDADPEGGPITVTAASDPAHGTTTFSAGNVTYAPDADYCNSPPPYDAFTYTVNGGDTATVRVTVTCVNDAPTAVDDDRTTAENTPLQDPVTGAGSPAANDTDVDGDTLTVTGVSNPTGGTVAIAAGQITFTPTADLCGDDTGSYDYTVSDGAAPTAGTDTGTVTIDIACANAPPVNTVPGDQTIDEDTVLTFTAGSAISVADADNPDLTVEVAVTDGTFTLATAAGLTSVVGNGTATVTISGPTANLNAAFDGATFAPSADFHGPAELTLTTSDGSGVDVDTVDITVSSVNDAPVADDETFSGADGAIGNTTLVVDDPSDGAPSVVGPRRSVSGDVLAGDVDMDSAGPLTVTAGTFTSNDGGSVTVQADGDFTYLPDDDVGCGDGSDFFDYTLNDGDSPNLTDTGRVTISVTDCVWYVQASAAAGGTGSSSAPFNTLASLNGAGGAGDVDDGSDYVFLYGGGAFGSGLALETGQRLFGEPHGLTVGGTALVPAGSTNPTITSAVGNGLTLGTDNTIQGIDLGSTPAGFASLVGSAVGTATVNTATPGLVNNTTGGAVDISGGTLAVSFTSVSSTNATGDGIRLDNTAGSFAAAGGSLQNAGGQDVDLSGNSSGDSVEFTFGGTITDDLGTLVNVSGQTAGTKDFNGALTDGNDGDGAGISLTGNTGATVRFDGGVTLSTGTNPAFAATGGGAVVVTGSANALTTTTGSALTVTGTSIGANGLTFRSISSNGAPKAIVLGTTGAAGGLTVTGTGTTAGTGGTIQNSSVRGAELVNTSGVSLSNMNFVSANNSADGGGAGACDDLTITACNAAIYLNGVTGITLDRVNLSGTMVENGITGVGVSGLTMSNSSITGAGNEAHESGMELQNLSGTSTISDTDISFSATNSVDIVNTDVGASLTFDDVTLRDTQTSSNGEGGLQFRSFSSAPGQPVTNIDVVDSDLLRLRTQAVQVIGEDDSIVNVDVTGSTIDVGSDIGAGIDLNGNDTAQVRFNVVGNPTIHTRGGAAVNVTSFVDASITGRINNNGILVDGIGSGIRVLPQESSTGVVEARNNSLMMGPGNNSSAIDVQARFNDARLDITLDNNTLDGEPTALAEINVISGSSAQPGPQAPETNVVCADIDGNDALPGGATRSLRLRVSDLDPNDVRLFLEDFVTSSELTWDSRGNTPASGQNVTESLSTTAVPPSAPPAGTCAEPSNAPPA